MTANAGAPSATTWACHVNPSLVRQALMSESVAYLGICHSLLCLSWPDSGGVVVNHRGQRFPPKGPKARYRATRMTQATRYITMGVRPQLGEDEALCFAAGSGKVKPTFKPVYDPLGERRLQSITKPTSFGWATGCSPGGANTVASLGPALALGRSGSRSSDLKRRWSGRQRGAFCTQRRSACRASDYAPGTAGHLIGTWGLASSSTPRQPTRWLVSSASGMGPG